MLEVKNLSISCILEIWESDCVNCHKANGKLTVAMCTSHWAFIPPVFSYENRFTYNNKIPAGISFPTTLLALYSFAKNKTKPKIWTERNYLCLLYKIICQIPSMCQFSKLRAEKKN